MHSQINQEILATLDRRTNGGFLPLLEKIQLSGKYNLNSALDAIQSSMTGNAEYFFSRIRTVELRNGWNAQQMRN
jgi:hypothetical protein